MTAWGIIGIIFAVGIVSLVNICAIIICVNKMIDEKMRVKTELELKIFHEEMEYIDKSFEKLFAQLGALIEKQKKLKTIG